MIKVLVVDDHPLLRAGAIACFSQAEDFQVVGESDNACDALDLVRQTNPDVLLLDVRLKGGINGINVAREVRKQFPSVKIVVLTNYTYEPYVRAMLEAGVQAYIIKDTPPSEVMQAIRMVVRGRTVFSSRVMEKIVSGYLSSAVSGSPGPVEALTPREKELLQLLAEGLSNNDIAERLSLSVKAVQAHLTSIYGKLDVRSRSEAIVQAARKGLVVLDSESLEA